MVPICARELLPAPGRPYACYFEKLSSYIEKYRKLDPELSELIGWLAAAVRRANVKEDWSVVRYTGGLLPVPMRS